MRVTAIVIVVTLCCAVRADKPAATTRSTTRAAAAAKLTTYVSKSRGLRFGVAVPWERIDTSRFGADMADQAFQFAAGGDGEMPQRVTASTRVPPVVKVFVTEPCERQLDVTEVAKDTRAMLAGRGTIVEDRAIVVNGLPGWLLRWEDTIALQVPGKPDRPGPTVVQRKVIWVQNRTICDVGCVGDARTFAIAVKAADALTATLEWDASKR